MGIGDWGGKLLIVWTLFNILLPPKLMYNNSLIITKFSCQQCHETKTVWHHQHTPNKFGIYNSLLISSMFPHWQLLAEDPGTSVVRKGVVWATFILFLFSRFQWFLSCVTFFMLAEMPGVYKPSFARFTFKTALLCMLRSDVLPHFPSGFWNVFFAPFAGSRPL